jgi:hypothetical protein
VAGPGPCSEDPVQGGDAGDLQQPGVLGWVKRPVALRSKRCLLSKYMKTIWVQTSSPWRTQLFTLSHEKLTCPPILRSSKARVFLASKNLI